MAVAITANYNSSYHSPGFELTVTGLTGFNGLTIYRVDTSGEFLDTPVRGADHITPIGSTFAVTDYEAPVGKVITYRAEATASFAQDIFDRAVSPGWGTATTGQIWTTIEGDAVDISVGGGVGMHAMTVVNSRRATRLAVAVKEFNIRFDANLNTIVGGATIVSHLATNHIDSNNHLRWELVYNTTGDCTLRIRRVSGGTFITIATAATAIPVTAGSWYNIRCVAAGGRLQMRMWNGTEPDVWNLDVADPTPLTQGAVALASIRSTGNTNNTAVLSYDGVFVQGFNGASVNAESPSSGSTGVLSGYDVGTVWLKSVGQPAFSRRVNLSEWNGSSRPGRVLGEYEVLGRRNKVVITDVLSGREGSIVLATFRDGGLWSNDSSYRDLTALLDFGGTLLLQTTGVDNTGEADMYLEVTGVKTSRVGVIGGDFAHLFELEFIEVDRPATTQESLTLRTWQDVANQNANWKSVTTNHTSWLDVLQRSL